LTGNNPAQERRGRPQAFSTATTRLGKRGAGHEQHPGRNQAHDGYGPPPRQVAPPLGAILEAGAAVRTLVARLVNRTQPRKEQPMYPTAKARELAILLRISRELDVCGDLTATVDNPSELIAWGSVLADPKVLAWRAHDSGCRFVQVGADHRRAPVRGHVTAVLSCDRGVVLRAAPGVLGRPAPGQPGGWRHSAADHQASHPSVGNHADQPTRQSEHSRTPARITRPRRLAAFTCGRPLGSAHG
jgi:hypothetical protein